ncbi:C-type lectin domain family 6 member A [Biomphalaria pfeifferi]|uniref:C-type lectin domain family 6 member A n=1 Tax=Biomphalaria pfeifferi TaxID=112525 RepID=A0AAD8FF49_BIOPF|nr:C-type lectin domain family 6 member A [Biomphalaria pfeifferi]
MKSSISQLQSRISNHEILISNIRRQQDKAKASLDTVRSALFHSSSYFNGRRYFLTRYASFFNPNYGQSTCATYGGYLTELDSQSELNFVRSFVTSYGSSYFAVMMSATDEGHEGSTCTAGPPSFIYGTLDNQTTPKEENTTLVFGNDLVLQ